MKLYVIGGVAGGATAAARARRLNEEAEIVVFERGEYISFANCGLPYHIGEVIKDRADLLVTTADNFGKRYNVDIRLFTEVTAIDTKNRQVHAKNLKTGETYSEGYDKIILSPGAEPVRPPLPGIDSDKIFTLRNIPDTDRIKSFVDSKAPTSAVVVGGGFIGLEVAENLVFRGLRPTLIEKMEQVMPVMDYEMAGFMHSHLREKGVNLILGDGIASFEEKDGGLIVHTEKGETVAADMAVLSIGVKPECHLARDAGLEIGELGGIRVDDTMQTSDPNVYAVGDAVEVKDFGSGHSTMTPLAGPANKQGRIAADNVMGRRSNFRGTIGTSVVKLFDQTVASAGAGEKTLQRRGIPYYVSYSHSGSHASYYPGAEMMAVKLLFSPGSGKILGAQIVGGEGVDKRIDVLATAIHGSMTVFQLEELELAYAPPYGSAKDPVNMAGFVAANLMKGDVKKVDWNQYNDLDPETDVLLDVRDKDELEESGEIPGALNIPVNELRNRLPELDKSKRYIPFCAIGLRGYIAYRMMKQHGFHVRNLNGGYKTLMGAKDKIM
ncbi:MAG: FAD-dependent oxidoreductase [Desulfosalsimonadaceae bacterium]